MIRFIDLRNQIVQGDNDFAFYDTVTGTLLYFGDEYKQIFACKDDFVVSCNEHNSSGYNIKRFLDLMPSDIK